MAIAKWALFSSWWQWHLGAIHTTKERKLMEPKRQFVPLLWSWFAQSGKCTWEVWLCLSHWSRWCCPKPESLSHRNSMEKLLAPHESNSASCSKQVMEECQTFAAIKLLNSLSFLLSSTYIFIFYLCLTMLLLPSFYILYNSVIYWSRVSKLKHGLTPLWCIPCEELIHTLKWNIYLIFVSHFH